MFVQVNFVPVFTVRDTGLKAKFIIVTLLPLLVGVQVILHVHAGALAEWFAE